MPYGLYYPSLKTKVKNRVCKQFGIYYPSIVARQRHRQYGCGLEVLGNKVIDEEEENSETVVVDGDEDHAPVMNIYELLMNSEFIEIKTDRDN